MWVGIDWNDKELRVCAETVHMKAGQRDDDTEGRDSATSAHCGQMLVTSTKSQPGSPHSARL